MKNKNIVWIILSTALFFLTSCEDFIEKNISKKHVSVLTPADGFSSTSLTITFWWEEMDGAENYQLQIVKPSFSAIQYLVVDTQITDTRFVFTFSPGNFQWRIRAMNNGGNSEYTYGTFTIDSSTSLSNVTVILTSPANNHVTNNSSNTFKWDSVYNADEYRFQITNTTTSGIVTDITLTADSFVYFLPEGNYRWQVRAQNATSNSLYSSRLISIDLTAPPSSIIIYPLNGDTVTSPVNLIWRRDSSAVGDSLFVYNDSLLANQNYITYLTDTFYSFTDTILQNYYWRLKSKDNAGNFSNNTATFRFRIQ